MKYIILCAIVALFGCGDNKANQEQKRTERKAAAQHRFAQWAYVAKEKEVAPGETIKLVVIPGQLDISLLDTKCVIYTNREFKTSSMICPDANRNDLVEDE